jgi:LysM repeat protein
MKNPMQKLRRFFVRSRTFNASAARAATHAPAEDDGDSTRLSGAFIIVLVLHIIAVVGVFAFARIKESRAGNAPQGNPAPATPPKNAPAKPAAVKPPAAASLAVANPTATPHETIKPPASTTHTTHVVKDGETLTKIASTFSVGIPDLVSVNKLKNQDDIHAGQVLTIPSAKTTQKTPAATEIKPTAAIAQKTTPAPAERKTAKTYVVRKGDSPMKIAREYGCSYEELMKVNNLKDPKKIQTGQVLKLPVKNG